MKTSCRYLIHLGFVALFMMFACLGCSGIVQKMEKWSTSVSESADEKRKNTDVYFQHTSQYSWETMEIVADWYTGDSGNWKKLAEINPDVKPQKIEAGSEIFIPVKLLKTRKALPRNYASIYCKDCYRHTVRWPGESLSLIAWWYTGSTSNWRKLAKANPRLNPDRIKKGNVILIPPALMKNREPLPQKAAARYTPGYFAHTVKQDGEKIETIARWYTGNTANWKVIARVNPKLNPNKLVTGNEIYIPSNIIKTRRPLPDAQAEPKAETPETQPATVEKKMPAAEEEEIKIFGPKQFPKS